MAYRNSHTNLLLDLFQNFKFEKGLLCLSLYFVGIAFLPSCNTQKNKVSYSIGVDPSFAPLHLEGKENQIIAFSTELLQEIGKIEALSFSKVTVSYDDLFDGLRKHAYAAILNSLFPYGFYQDTYHFSDLYLQTGPVLVVRKNSALRGLADLNGKEVAIQPQTRDTLLLEKYPGILIRSYASIPDALNALAIGTIDAALVDCLLAKTYVQDLYQEELSIATAPLDQEGLRLVTLSEENSELIQAFNRGLENLKKNKKYDALLQKWGL